MSVSAPKPETGQTLIRQTDHFFPGTGAVWTLKALCVSAAIWKRQLQTQNPPKAKSAFLFLVSKGFMQLNYTQKYQY